MAERIRQDSSPHSGPEVESLPPPPTRAAQGRTYDEKAVADILQRAAKLDRRRTEGRAELSLAELEQIAADSGIDPAMVRQAIRDQELQGDAALSTRLAGAPVRRTLERVVGREISAEEHEALVSDIRATLAPMTSVPPQLTSLGRSLTYSSVVGRSLVEVHVAPRDGKTTIRVTVNASKLAGGLFGGLLGGLGGGVGTQVAILSGMTAATALDWPVPASVAVGAAGFLGVFTGAFSLARMIFAYRAGRVHAVVDALADRLEATVKAGK